MTVVQESELEPIEPNVASQSEQNRVNEAILNNISLINQEALNARQVSSIGVRKYNANGFIVRKLRGLEQYIGFTNVSPITGTFDIPENISVGNKISLSIENNNPSVNTVTISLNGNTIEGSTDTSIVLKDNKIYSFLCISEGVFKLTESDQILKTIYFPLIIQSGGGGSSVVSSPASAYSIIGIRLNPNLNITTPNDLKSIQKVELVVISNDPSPQDYSFTIDLYKTNLGSALNETIVETETYSFTGLTQGETRNIDLTSLFTSVTANQLCALVFTDTSMTASLFQLNGLTIRMTYK